MPSLLAEKITNILSIPTIGIGAGHQTDGQVLVWHDMLGLQNTFKPKFLKQFVHTEELMLAGIEAYINDVQNIKFPTPEHAF